ncbi:MAG: Molybdopterin synthase subunit MoaD [uncultured Thiotrichaceae bacterium]|uniref:Molybdopterin synthase sulfur carrier subunit n=1 Tax=uncultured Thiotrichaceae bacterium TaxID=298394 RepID=A0A6S6S0X0_9GAMM|nr:MAG: Molybdopterin synthase subunit MoaD [uncultured Thiotrichaceae bacterium]
MQIKVCYFASLRETIGRAEDQLDLDDQALTAGDVWKLATQQDAMPDNILIAQNHDYIDAQTLINDGDEIAFFPPVTGG